MSMAFSISFSSSTASSTLPFSKPHRNHFSSFPVSISVSANRTCHFQPLRLLAAAAASKSQTGPPVKKGAEAASSPKKRKRKGRSGGGGGGGDSSLDGWDLSEVEIVDDYRDDEDNDDDEDAARGSSSSSNSCYVPPAMPKPPAGFVVDETGRVLMASNKRIATIVDSTNNSPLECVIRRVFTSSKGDECMLLCPVDTPVQILKSTNIEGWSAVSDEEVEALLPAAAYALAKIHMHLVHSGFCYTARGGFCYTEDDIFDFRTDDGQDVEGLPTEGIEITSFHLDGAHYMIYTPSDPLLFVAVKDQNGQLQIADDDLLDDPAIISTIDEETEFNALVEEEAALLESLLGERV